MAGLADLLGAAPGGGHALDDYNEAKRKMSRIAFEYLMKKNQPNLSTSAGMTAYQTILTTISTYGTLTGIK